MVQSLPPITTREVRSHSLAMLDIPSQDPQLGLAREEFGLETTLSVQVL